MVHTLALLEPALLAVPSAPKFFENVAPAVAAYDTGDREGAMAHFLSFVSSLDWASCQNVIEQHIPGGVRQAIKDADTFFEGYLPALGAWEFGTREAATISQPVLSILGTKTEALFVEGRTLLHSWFPQISDCTIKNAAHLLQLQEPAAVARGIAEFIARYPITTYFSGLRTAASSNAAMSL
jgi:pimeloyl-ACP methyl ester carboxylesterase